MHFRRFFGDPYSRYQATFDPERAERLQATGFTVAGLDSSEPDVNEGRVGRDRYAWIREQFDKPGDIKIVTVHHHLVGIPGTGRERNIVLDAADVLLTLTDLDIDLVLSGHKHVPFFWGVNGLLICNSGTAGTRRGLAAVVERAAHRRGHDQGLHALPRRAARAVGDLQPEDARPDARGVLHDRGLPALEPGRRLGRHFRRPVLGPRVRVGHATGEHRPDEQVDVDRRPAELHLEPAVRATDDAVFGPG